MNVVQKSQCRIDIFDRAELSQSFLVCSISCVKSAYQVTIFSVVQFQQKLGITLSQCFPFLGTIHLRHRHVLGGRGQKICQICRRIVLKNCRRQGGRGQKFVKICRRLKWMVPNAFPESNIMCAIEISMGSNLFCLWELNGESPIDKQQVKIARG